MDDQTLEKIIALLRRTKEDQRPVVLMTCGIAGAGKSTLAKTILQRLDGFTRLSNDEIVFQRHGLYGVDYAADMALYDSYQDEADAIYMDQFVQLLEKKQDVILDRSFYAKEDREEFRQMIERLGGRRVLVFFKGDKEFFWQRITNRSKEEKTANNALAISRELFEMYWRGFEIPDGEGEIVIQVR